MNELIRNEDPIKTLTRWSYAYSMDGEHTRQIAKYIQGLRAKLQSVESKITALSETIDSQHQTNVALVNKLEAAEKVENELMEDLIIERKKNRDHSNESLAFQQRAWKAEKIIEGFNENSYKMADIVTVVKSERDELQQQLSDIFDNITGAKCADDVVNHLEKLRTNIYELQAQVAVMQEALENIMNHTVRYAKESDTGYLYRIARQAIETTPAKTAERAQGLVDALKEIKYRATAFRTDGFEKLVREALDKYRGEAK